MEPTRSPRGQCLSPAFLVERYVPAGSAESLGESVADVASLCALQEREPPVRYLQSLYVPSEETCFCVFQAPSEDIVRAVNNEGHFALDRITSGVLISAAEPN